MEAAPLPPRGRRSVHWDDQREARTTPYSVSSTDPLLLGGGARTRRRRDGASLSAATTLSLYLSEARPSPARRRHALGATTTQQSIQGAMLPNRDQTVATVQGDSLPPGSPLSRFLQRRVHQEGAPLTLLQNSPSASQHPERAVRVRALRLSSAPAPGSMERLLREKINEAKTIREQLSSPPRARENQPPNGTKRPDHGRAKEAVVKTASGGSPRLSREVPVPHPKPQRPQMQAPVMRTSVAEPTQKRIAPPSSEPPQALRVRAGHAARKIQRLYRRFFLHRRHRHESERSPGTDTVPLATVEDTTASSATTSDNEAGAERADGAGKIEDGLLLPPVHPTCDDDSGHTEDLAQVVNERMVAEAAIQTDRVDSKYLLPAEKEDHTLTLTSTAHHSAKMVMWQDDEWSYLEEGWYATNELLDSSAHDEDTSVEALVWKRPHVVVELQEAKRCAAETARRSIVKKSQDVEFMPLSTVTQAVAKPVRIKIRHKAPRARPTIARNATRRRRQQRQQEQRTESRVPPLIEEEDGTTHEPSTHDTVTSEQQPTDEPEDGVYAALLAQLHRYVDFSDVPLATDSSDGDSSAMRNDLITVDSFVLSKRTEQDESVSDREETRDEAGHVSSEDGRDDSERPGREDTDHALSLSLSVTSPVATDVSLVSNAMPSLSPQLRHVEREFQHTLGRIQSQYALALQPVALYDSDASLSEQEEPTATATASPIDNTTQREFRRALDAFEQSLRASRASTSSEMASLPSLPSLPSPPRPPLFGRTDPLVAVESMEIGPIPEAHVASEEKDDAKEANYDDDGAVDAELEAMLREIRRCKQQIAQARRQSQASHA